MEDTKEMHKLFAELAGCRRNLSHFVEIMLQLSANN